MENTTPVCMAGQFSVIKTVWDDGGVILDDSGAPAVSLGVILDSEAENMLCPQKDTLFLLTLKASIQSKNLQGGFMDRHSRLVLKAKSGP